MNIRSAHWRVSIISARFIAVSLGVGLIVFMAVLATAMSKWRNKPEQSTVPEKESRPIPETPFRNAHPEVRYVGDEVCARCHADMAAAYRKHPMSHSLAPVSSAEPLEKYDPAAHNPFDAQGFHYQVERQGEHIYHKETRLDV